MGNTFTDGSLATGTVGLCSVTQVKDRIGLTGTADDTRIDLLITAVTRAFAARFGREFIPRVTEARVASVTGLLVDLPGDLVTATSVILHPEAESPVTLAANADYALWPPDPDRLTGTYTMLRLAEGTDVMSEFASSFGAAQLEVTGTWGIWSDVSEVPDDVSAAAIETVLSWLDRSTAGIAALDGGDPRGIEPQPVSTWDIPASAWRKMQPYERRRLVW